MSHKDRRQAFLAAKAAEATAASAPPAPESVYYGSSEPMHFHSNAINFSVMDRTRSIQMLNELKESNRLQRSSQQTGRYWP